ncbi:MAG: histidine phosphatase family protein, partial [Eubacteriales bacterium]|nr:histidine phosphatase family protein [Eubacteriales bacterium]
SALCRPCSCAGDFYVIECTQALIACDKRGAIMIYLMRHGADSPDRLGGWSPYGLTEEGRLQVHNANNILSNTGITKIYASDLARAKETAEIVANALSLPITYLPQFRESNNGLLAGMLKTKAAEQYPGIYWNALDWTETYPEGESPSQFFHRIQAAWVEFKKRVGKSNILLVSHGGVMNIILCLENGIPYTNKETHFQIRDAEIVQIDINFN